MKLKNEATIEDLYHAESKAELVNGEIVIMTEKGFFLSKPIISPP